MPRDSMTTALDECIDALDVQRAGKSGSEFLCKHCVPPRIEDGDGGKRERHRREQRKDYV